MASLKNEILAFTVALSFFLLQKIDGCVCINPGRLTKKASGGTYAKISVPDIPAIKEDLSSDIGVQIVYI